MKKIIVIVGLFTLLSSSVLAFAWWDRLNVTSGQTLTIGQGVTLVVEAIAEAPEGTVLVPSGVVLKPGDVTEIVLTYNVRLDIETIDSLELIVGVSNVQIGGSSLYGELVTIVITQEASLINTENILVTVTVALEQPITQEAYDAIVNQDITFDLNFTAQ